MKTNLRSGLAFCFLYFVGTSQAFADIAKCRIVGAKDGSAFATFVGGKVVIDLANGNTTFFHAVNDLPVSLSPISETTVSTFQADRAACTYGTEKIIHQDGTLRAKLFRFSSCVHHDAQDPSQYGYVQADVGFDLASRTGKYREIFLAPTGTPPSSYADFEDCRVE